MFYSVVTNAPFIRGVEKGVETSIYITEFAVIRILSLDARAVCGTLGSRFRVHGSGFRFTCVVVIKLNLLMLVFLNILCSKAKTSDIIYFLSKNSFG